MIEAHIVDIRNKQAKKDDHERDLEDNKKYSKFLDDVIKLAQDQEQNENENKFEWLRQRFTNLKKENKKLKERKKEISEKMEALKELEKEEM